jgi:beta-phosphoglucomutase-like phosphatase (HAD superfamily)
LREALTFDLDGTLAETDELHRRAFNETFAGHGLGWHWTRADYARLLTTAGGRERLARHAAETGARGIGLAPLHRAGTGRFASLAAAGSLALRPGVPDLREHACAAGLDVIVTP